MKLENRFVVLLLAGTLMLGGCSQNPIREPSSLERAPEAHAQAPLTVHGELAKLNAEEGNWLNLTKEQMLEDADYLYQILQKNFPYYNVIQRKLGVNMEAEYLSCLKEIESCQTDAQFYVTLDRWIEKAQGMGHLMLLQPDRYFFSAQLYKEYASNNNKDVFDLQRLSDVYNNEKAKTCYEGMKGVFDPIYVRAEAYYAALESKKETVAQAKPAWENVETKILEPGKIAYIAINNFDSFTQVQDKQILFNFYRQVKNYEHVIFDFTQNGGGSMGYFNELVAAPNTSKPLAANVYTFLMGGDYNLSFFDISKWNHVFTLPALARMNKEDLSKLDFYANEPYVVEPAGEKQLDGKLWMLVGPNVFSSSEYAAMLCKSTGFMTLVGTTTGGDGIGYDPVPVMLPNSGLVVKYSAIYGTTGDGAGSQEWGTEPDITSPDGEQPLDTCLNAIHAHT